MAARITGTVNIRSKGGAGNVAHVGVHCYSSQDLCSWTDEGVALRVSEDSESEITKGSIIERLTDDYLDHDGTYIRAFPGRHMEAPAICKRNGKYYLIASGCTGWAPNAARSAVADNILGPWNELGNPCVGINPQSGLGPEKTFGGQSTFILPVEGKEDAYIAMFDIWRPEDAIDGRYVWLPMRFTEDGLVVEWRDEWSIGEL
jgi:hypothetical protein